VPRIGSLTLAEVGISTSLGAVNGRGTDPLLQRAVS
jgi:hypothetical protein